MEMQNAAVSQLLSTQTTILEEIKAMRIKEQLDINGKIEPATSFATLPNSYTSPVSSPVSLDTQQLSFGSVQNSYQSVENPSMPMFDSRNYYDNIQTDMPPIAQNPYLFTNPTMQTGLTNPVQYQNISNVQARNIFNPTSITKEVESIVAFDPSRMSKNARADYIAEQSQGFQLGAVNTVATAGGFLGTGASMMMGGFLPSLAVGGAVAGVTAFAGNAMVSGAKESMAYQDILRRSGYKAFNALESTSEFGGIGMSLDDQQELSGFMRELAIDEFLEDSEMQSILQGSLDQKLLKSTTGVKDFKEKFKKIVNSVKEVSVMLDGSLEEAVEFLGEMERRGVGERQATRVGASMKIGASFLGMDAADYSQIVMQQSDAITQGTSLNSAEVMSSISQNAYILESITTNAKDTGNTEMYNYIKNNGGASQFAGQIEGLMRNTAVGSDSFRQYAMGYLMPAIERDEFGNLTLDSNALAGILSSDKSGTQLMNDSTAHSRQWDVGTQQIVANNLGEIINNSASSTELSQIYAFLQKRLTEDFGMSDIGALQSTGLNVDYTTAQIMNQFLTAATNENVINQFTGKVNKELLDTTNIAESPGLGKRLKYWWKDTFTEPFADAGAWTSDLIGDFSQDVQMRLRGLEDGTLAGSTSIEKLNSESIRDFFYGESGVVSTQVDRIRGFDTYEESTKVYESVRDNYEITQNIEKLNEVTSPEKKTISDAEWRMLLDGVKSNSISTVDLYDMQMQLKSGDLSKDTEQRYKYLINSATGEYDGEGALGTVSSKGKQLGDYLAAAVYFGDGKDSDGVSLGSEFDSLKAIEKEEKSLKKEAEKLEKKVKKTLLKASDELTSDEVNALDLAIRSGDLDAAKKITKDEKILSVAEEYTELLKNKSNLDASKESYFDIQDTAKVIGKSTEGAYAYLRNAGIFSEEEFHSYFGDQIGDVQHLIEDMDGMKLEELAKTSTEIYEENSRFFESLSSTKKEEIAQSLIDNNFVQNIDELYKEGTHSIDGSKIFEVLAQNAAAGQSDNNEVVEAISGTEVTEKLTDHQKALHDMLSAWTEETRMIHSTLSEIKTTINRSNSTSTTFR